MKKIQEYLKQSYGNSVAKGWYENPTTPIERFALMISEVSEAIEEIRLKKPDYYVKDGKPEGQSVEMVDILIRIFDYAGYKNINFSKFIESQFFMSFNEIDTLESLMNEVKDINNLRCNDELTMLNTDIEYNASIAISVCEAMKSYMKNNDKEFFFLAEVVVKIAYFFHIKKWDMVKLIDIKHEFNLNRPHKHGGKTC